MKRGKRALILAGVLAVLVLVYVGVQKGVSSQPEAVTEESGSYPLTSHTAEELTSLQWTSGDGEEQETLHFVKTDGQWRVEGDEAFPVKQDSVEGLAETLTALKADRKLENVEKPEDYGLLEPAFTLTAGWSDGTETVYSMGDETPFGDGYYLSLSGEDGTVYTVADALSGDFSGSLLSFAQSEELPAVENVTRLVVGDTLDVEGTAEKTDDEALSGYGLTDEQATAITLYDGETIVWKLLAGAEADEGGHYVRLPDSAMVYTADVASLLEADVGSLYDAALTDLTAEEVSTISVKAGDQLWEYAADIVETAAENSDANGDTDTETAAETPRWEQLFEKFSAMKATGRVAETPGTTPVLEAQIVTRTGGKETFVFFLYDESSYLMPINETTGYLFSADKADQLLRVLRLWDAE